MARKKGGNNKITNHNHNNNFNNNSKWNNRNNYQNATGKYCTHCKMAGHSNAECFHKPGNKNHNPLFTVGTQWGNKNARNDDDDPKFKKCKLCQEWGHDLTTCKVLAKELKSHGIPIQQNGVNGLFVPNTNQEGLKEHFQNGSKVNKNYVNPFLREKIQPNPFAELKCTHSAQCRGLCGNDHYLSKTRELKRQLEEALNGMQLWLDTITPPEEDPHSMDWEAAPTIEIPQTNHSHVDPLRLWNAHQKPVRIDPTSVFQAPQRMFAPRVLSIDNYLKTNSSNKDVRTVPQFITKDVIMDLDEPVMEIADATRAAKLAATNALARTKAAENAREVGAHQTAHVAQPATNPFGQASRIDTLVGQAGVTQRVPGRRVTFPDQGDNDEVL